MVITNEQEDALVKAHKTGIRLCRLINGNLKRGGRFAYHLYQTEAEIEAFMAGFAGEKRRSNGSRL